MFSLRLMGCSTNCLMCCLTSEELAFEFPPAALLCEVEAVACRFGDLTWKQQGVPPPDFSVTRPDWATCAGLPC